MSFSSRDSTPSSSLSMSASSKAMSIGGTTHASATNNASTHVHEFSSCTLRKRSFDTPSAYVSDEDLFGEDDLPYLSEPPPPPRPAEAFLARPLLPPVTRPLRRSSSGHKTKASKQHKVTFKV